MTNRLEWSQQARTELETILLGLHDWDADAARRWRARLVSRVESLRDYPELGRETAAGSNRAPYRQVVVGVYLIVYQLFPGRVRIVSIRDGRRSPRTAGTDEV